MGLFKLCDNDPLVNTLTDVFHANIVRVPEERLQPLGVIAARNKNSQLSYRGVLGDLIAGPRQAELGHSELKTADMADVTGKRSRQVNASLGLEILSGFLRGFGMPGAAGIQEQFAGAAEVSFSFGHVQRRYIEPLAIGRLLSGKQLNSSNPAARGFLQDDAWDCLLIDSVITSSAFSINVERHAAQDFKLNVPAIEQVLADGKAQLAVSSSSALSLTFQGPKALSFAFSCQRLIFDQAGTIIEMPPDASNRVFKAEPARLLLAEGPALLFWDDERTGY